MNKNLSDILLDAGIDSAVWGFFGWSQNHSTPDICPRSEIVRKFPCEKVPRTPLHALCSI